MECYIDVKAIKSHAKEKHLSKLIEVFNLMRAYQLKIFPAKSFLGVSSGKFLRFVVTAKGIHLDQEMVHAIQKNEATQKSLCTQGTARKIGLHPKIYFKSLRTMPTLLKIVEDGNLLIFGINHARRHLTKLNITSRTCLCVQWQLPESLSYSTCRPLIILLDPC